MPLSKHPRFHLNFMLTSSAWLNLVELFFRKLTDKTIHRGIFTAAVQRNRRPRHRGITSVRPTHAQPSRGLSYGSGDASRAMVADDLGVDNLHANQATIGAGGRERGRKRI